VIRHALAALVLVGSSAVPGAAQDGERIRSYEVEVDALPSGRIHVVETIDYDFGGNQKHGIYRNIPVRFDYDDDYRREYPLRSVRVTGTPGTPVQTKVERSGDYVNIRVGDPDRTITGTHRYVLSYDVDGAINRFESHDELFWNAIGVEWAVPIDSGSVTVRTSGAIETVACFAGPEGSRIPCASARADGTSAYFSQGALGAYEGLSVVVALPAGYAATPGPVLKEKWKFSKAFSPSAVPAGLAVLVLVSGVYAVARLTWRTGRDRRWPGLVPGLEPVAGAAVPEEHVPLFGRGAVSVEYEPGDDMRPALMGVLMDEQADPLDVTATVVDLAVRRHLTIEELPRRGLFRRRDWKIRRLDAPTVDLARWESTLLAALFEKGDEVEVSDLKNEFHTHLKQIQEQLYADVVTSGWFTRRPDSERGRWFGIAMGVVVLGGGLTWLLAKYTSFGLVGVATVLVGLVLLSVHKRMPFRTAKGTAALDRARAFRRYLATAEAEQLRYEEREGIFARYLPYAVVLGEAERWAKAFGDLGGKAAQELYWYSGPNGWSAADFGDSMSSFATSTAGTLASAPGGGSGFGGGGAGGGGGGGGGGSW
jgi:hypothetical protein